MEEEGAQAQLISKKWMKFLLIINCIILSIGNCGGRLIMRLYFIRGGSRIWFSSWLETAGWPVTLIPLIISYLFRRRNKNLPYTDTKPILIKRTVFIASAVIGILTGVDDYLFAYGVARLPVSTSTLIVSSHLAFTALFSFLLVKQKFTAYSINSIVLLTVASGILGMNTSGDRPKGESNKLYVLGFILTLGAAALYGLILPLVEMMYIKGKQRITYTLVLEIQLVMSFFATAFCTVGMILNNDFKVIPREAREYELGERKYYMVAVWSAIMWQCFYVGAIGVIFCASSLFSGVAIAVLLPPTEILAVILFKERFGVEKGVSLILSIWGFISYFYGEMKQSKKARSSDEDQLQTPKSDLETRSSDEDQLQTPKSDLETRVNL